MNEDERKKLLAEMLAKAVAIQLHQETLLTEVIKDKTLRAHIQSLINNAQQIGQLGTAYLQTFGEMMKYDNLTTKSVLTVLNLDSILSDIFKNKKNIMSWKIPKNKENRL